MSGLQWKRLAAGLYEAGPYTVSKPRLSRNWCAQGPGGPTVGVQREHPTKVAAQRACEEAEAWNAARSKAVVEPYGETGEKK